MVPMLHLLVPEDVDDPLRPSGGNVYDRRVRDGLLQSGRPVRQVALSGDWADPGPSTMAGLARALAAIPNGDAVLVDGLVGCAAPQVVVSHTARLDVVVLVHVPPGEEPGTHAQHDAGGLLRAARAVVATSPWTAQRLSRCHGVDPASIIVAVPGTDPAPLVPGTDGATSLLAVGSITPTKGHDLLIAALARLDGLPWRCRIVGPECRSPGFAAALRRTIADRDLDARISLEGPRAGAALEAEYAAADLVVVPSRTESYGMVVTEALARGIPVLAARIGGVTAALGSAAVPELLIEPGDPAALAAGLRRWLTDRKSVV